VKNFINKTYDYLFALLLVLLPFKAMPNIVIAIMLVCFIADCRRVDFKPLKKLPAILYYGFLLYFFIKAGITGSLFSEWDIYKKFIILFFIPVLFLKVKNANIVKAGVVAGVTVSVLATLVLAAKYYFEFGMLPFGNGEVVNTLMLLERPYAGFLAVAGALFSLSLIKEYPRHTKLLVACCIMAIAFILIIAARLSFLTLIVLAFIYALFYYPAAVGRKIIFMAVCLGAVSLVFVLNRNIADRFFVKESLEVATDYEPRVVIWPCAYDLAQQDDFNPLFGYPGNTIVENRYVDCYTSSITNNQDKNEYFRKERFNSHNQFIDFYLTTGIIGLVLFIGFFAALFIRVKRDFAYTAILMATVLFLMVENVLHRQMGCYIFSIFVALLLTRKITANDKN
jgi:O-antigen ligase